MAAATVALRGAEVSAKRGATALGWAHFRLLVSCAIILISGSLWPHLVAGQSFPGPFYLTPAYRCGSGGYEFGIINFNNGNLARLTNTTSFNLTVVSTVPSADGKYPFTDIGTVVLQANSPAGSVTVTVSNQWSLPWPRGVVVSWKSPLLYRDVCGLTSQEIAPAGLLANTVAVPPGAATITFSIPFVQLSRPAFTGFSGEPPCERSTQIAALFVKVYIPVLAGLAPEFAPFQGRAAFAGTTKCDRGVYDNGDYEMVYEPYRVMDLELTCDCDARLPTCGSGGYQLRIDVGYLLPTPADINILSFAANGSITLAGYASLDVVGGSLRAVLTRPSGLWPAGAVFSWVAYPDDTVAATPPDFNYGFDSPPDGGAPPPYDFAPDPGSAPAPPPLDYCSSLPALWQPAVRLEQSRTLAAPTAAVTIDVPLAGFGFDEQGFCGSFRTPVGKILFLAKVLLPASGPTPSTVAWLGFEPLCEPPTSAATVWANPLNASISYTRTELGGAEYVTLKVTNLDPLTARGGPLRVCFLLESSGPCASPGQLCYGPGCRYALFNPEGTCCPTNSFQV
ncbi:hypothetical protein GPECTOR_7g967 [Gonium pectorale]|uniref:Pherophorin domain-containing protein n=1 Tax=Gonium pectorale TaxID=33097 RepID=A0A150GUH2_GONPE|nr:hypothetical protein GPECTOR_7g967 [Gonium pectorale]|eukprot:KXZ53517.1 hypothetical protein GPECTOR_7g967 [Gonium pectorale]